jgi:anti-sigma factor RsiW
MAKLSKAERQECEKNLAVCQAAVATFQKILADDDQATKAAEASSEREIIKTVVKEHGATAGFLAIRLAGGRPGGPQS